MQWYANFGVPAVPGVSAAVGQCPCTDPAAPVLDVPICEDNSAEYVVRVSRKAGFPTTCDNYVLEISNGKYPAP
jgi:hypothetical protein